MIDIDAIRKRATGKGILFQATYQANCQTDITALCDEVERLQKFAVIGDAEIDRLRKENAEQRKDLWTIAQVVNAKVGK